MKSEIQKITNDRNFLKLHRELSKFNIFQATGIGNQETKHTNFLRYLLDPNESHGFKEELLLRFFQFLPIENSDNKINILDCNFSYAKVEKEFTIIETDGTISRVDLLITIPSVSEPSKLYLIGIENKIRAKQNPGQLVKYSKALAKDSRYDAEKATFLFLTVDDEEMEPNWISIKYSETIFTAINSLLEDLDETLSSYIKYILQDYLDYITSIDGSQDFSILEDLASKIESDQIIQLQSAITPEARNARIKYSKAFDYLSTYDTDAKNIFVKAFEACFSGDSDIFPLQLETSNKWYLRFSFLSPENGNSVKALADRDKYNWLESGRNIAFEISIKPKKNDDANPTETPTFDLRVKLVLGPLNTSEETRKEILEVLRNTYEKTYSNKEKKPLSDRFTPRFTSFAPMAKYNRSCVASESAAKECLSKLLEKIKANEADLIDNINTNLKDYFSGIMRPKI